MKTDIPKEIAHLDFEPHTTPAEGFSRLKECTARRKGTTEECTRPASWKGTYRCCMRTMTVCHFHKERGASQGWWCNKCNKKRDDEWIGWTRL